VVSENANQGPEVQGDGGEWKIDPVAYKQNAHASDPLQQLVEQVSDYAIFVLDPQGQIASWNAGAMRIKGYTAKEIVGEHFSKFYRPEDRWKCAVELETAAREGRVEDVGWRVRKDGSLFWADVVITCLRDPAGRIVGYGKVTRDLSEQLRAQESLRQAEERFGLLVASVKDYAIFMLDPAGRVATWNPGAERIKGYTAAEIVGQHFSRFYPNEDVEAGRCERMLEIATRDGRVEDEGFRVRKDGSRFWANVVISAIRNGGGQLVGFAKVTRDLTERRAAESERLRIGQLAQERIHALGELSESLTFAFSVDDVGNVLGREGARLTGAERCTLHLYDGNGRLQQWGVEHGENPDDLPAISRLFRQNTGHSPNERANTAIWVESAEQARALTEGRAAEPRSGAFCCIPLVAEGTPIGVLGIWFARAFVFSDDEREFLATFARQFAQAIARAGRVEAERQAASVADHLRASLLTTLRSIGDALIATDAAGNITLMNNVAEALTSWPEQEARGKPLPEVFRIVNEHSRKTVENPVDRVLSTGGVVGLANHTVLLARDGREIPIDDSGAPVRTSDGKIDGVVLVFRDVSARKQEEKRRAFLADTVAALGASLEYEQTITRVAQLCVPALADWCRVDLWEQGEQWPSHSAVAHVDPEKAELVRQLAQGTPTKPQPPSAILNVVRTGQSLLHSEISDERLFTNPFDAEQVRVVRELKPQSAMFIPLIARGEAQGMMTFVYAGSDRRYTADDLEYVEQLAARCAIAIDNARLFSSEQDSRHAAEIANRSKDEFLAIVSHELRTPLNAIMGWSKLLAGGHLDQTRYQSAFDTIERNTVAMAQLVEDLLDMSRIVSGKMRLEVQRVDLAEVAGAAVDSVRLAASARGIALTSVLDTTLNQFLGDPTRLQQIIWNLLSNAVKFTAKGGTVNIVLRRLDSSVEIAVSDTGKGIAPNFLPYVFEAFRQEDASMKRTLGGLGLGLAITRELVELHGGSIVAESEGLGRGAKFTVTLPVAAVSPPRRTSSSVRESKPGDLQRPTHLGGLSILALDDEPDARSLLRAVLEDCGCRVTTCASVSEAMHALASERPDVVLSDVGMPGADGYEFIRQLRALPRERGGDLPVAALTAYAGAGDRKRLLNAGFSIHLAKPIDPAELLAVVGTLARFRKTDG